MKDEDLKSIVSKVSHQIQDCFSQSPLHLRAKVLENIFKNIFYVNFKNLHALFLINKENDEINRHELRELFIGWVDTVLNTCFSNLAPIEASNQYRVKPEHYTFDD